MARWGSVVAGIVVFALVASQILLPRLGASRVEDRLTEGGGSAEVTLGAVPGLRLLFADGERLEVDAQDLDLELDEREAVFDRLDGFTIVDISISNSATGPFELATFELHRDGAGPYTLLARGETTASELTAFGFDQLELPGESFLDLLLEPFVEQVDGPLPIQLDMELSSDEGRVEVISGGGEVAGIPTGPLAELITSAIVLQL